MGITKVSTECAYQCTSIMRLINRIKWITVKEAVGISDIALKTPSRIDVGDIFNLTLVILHVFIMI